MRLINPTPEATSFLREWEDDRRNYIVAHTSGTTGTPKEIHLLKADMLASAKATNRFFGLNQDSVLVCPLSASYIAGKMMVVRALVSGAILYFESPSSSPLEGGNYPVIDLLPIVPAQIDSLKNISPGQIRNVIVGGAPLSAEQETVLREMPFRAYATYGMTETCSHVALRHIDGVTPYYDAMPGISFSTDERGCLVVTAPEFSIGRLTTNDIVELYSSSSFRWLGRADNVIITGGLKVHPEMLEKQLSGLVDYPFYITSIPSAKWGREVAIVIEGSRDTDFEEMLVDRCCKILMPHERPRHFIWVPRFNYTSSGKLIRT